MKEFGSDFHYLPVQYSVGKSIRDYIPNATYYACGRHALIDLYKQNGWKCLWVPEYFCYSVLSALIWEGVNLKFYFDHPLADERETILSLPFEEGDALLRMNYFGLRSRRSNLGIKVPVIEDHTHDLIGEWARNSDADWCIASLRKTLPLAEGGILWSPKGEIQQFKPSQTCENEMLASKRWNAMRKKAMYLDDKIADKNEFRADMISTEEQIDRLNISKIDEETFSYLSQFDIDQWYQLKRSNWALLKDIKLDKVSVLEPEGDGCYPFSLILLFDSEVSRDRCRNSLINNDVYPALLWKIPSENKHPEVKDFSNRMLSIHCDARYGVNDVKRLYDIITSC